MLVEVCYQQSGQPPQCGPFGPRAVQILRQVTETRQFFDNRPVPGGPGFDVYWQRDRWVGQVRSTEPPEASPSHL